MSDTLVAQLSAVIPLTVSPSQTLSTLIGGQTVGLAIYQKSTGLYVDVYLNGALLVAGCLARNGVPLIRSAYFGFPGDLAFFDTQGTDDPAYTGLGSRWFLGVLT